MNEKMVVLSGMITIMFLAACGDPINLRFPPPGTAEPTEVPSTPEPPAGFTAVTYEAENSEIVAPVPVYYSDPGYSGRYVVANIGEGESAYIQFNDVTVPATGVYKCAIRYLRWEFREAYLSINGAPGHPLFFAGTDFMPRVKEIDIVLEAGRNTLRFYSESYLPNLDCITIDRRDDFPSVYEAESILNELTVIGDPYYMYDPEASGSGVIMSIGEGHDRYLQYNYVMAPRAGIYKLTMFYHTWTEYTSFISVNGGAPAFLGFADSNCIIAGKELEVFLQAGENSIRFYSDFFVPSFDCITIGPREEFPVVYEAESEVNDFYSSAPVYQLDLDASGTAKVGGADGYIQFNGVMAETGGFYDCSIEYSSTCARAVCASVNGSPAIPVLFPGTDGQPASKSVTFSLRQGDNSIMFYSDSGLPLLDCLHLEAGL